MTWINWLPIPLAFAWLALGLMTWRHNRPY